MERTRLSREESRAQTVARILAAADALFRAKGFAGVSVAEIAEEAGYSTGAVYANFPSKGAVLLEINRRWRDDEDRELGALMAQADSPAAALAALRRWHAGLRRDESARFLLDSETRLVMARRPELRAVGAEGYRQARVDLAARIAEQAARLGMTLLQPADVLATLLIALRRGIEAQCWFDDDAVPDDVFPRGVALLFGLDPDAALGVSPEPESGPGRS
ncbi:TetR/AcrR family transcriptional regulator [Frankia sp. AgB32]|uniref:TetR/AcrR family transcriptional regulator n=1 Tax=Frankia sp. AgB32 TaxID=631119 RepID=UPI0020106E54|nr:TetR/AcrR family transcriptional regulator [Frankia sp. AgB32]MCK9896698.1 TetR/AcrR family transcriptional regulator [Frankia sp. AgB32]